MKNKQFTLAILSLSILSLCSLFVNLARNNVKVRLARICHSKEPVFTRVSECNLSAEPIRIPQIECSYRPVLITYKEMELTYLGTYFITAYCPAECGGSWTTASGETCHRASWNYRLSEPTTCAISRSVHSFGDEFYIPEFDRTFVAEDTGPGVQGKHLDLFYEDYEDVVYFPTGYYDVYAVEWVEKTVVATEEDLKYLSDMPATEYYWELN